MTKKTCTRCGGTGTGVLLKCPECAGKGIVDASPPDYVRDQISAIQSRLDALEDEVTRLKFKRPKAVPINDYVMDQLRYGLMESEDYPCPPTASDWDADYPDY